MSFDELVTGRKGRGLIAFSDAAGAKACLAFAQGVRDADPGAEFQLVSNKRYDFYADQDLSVEVVDNPDILLLDDIAWLFTGTSHPDSSDRFEVKFLERALKNGIPAEAFIDHRTNLALRFELDGKFIFPQTIYMTDEALIPQAVSEGIPRQALKVIENPYLHYIRHSWKSMLSNAQFRELYEIPVTVKTVLVYAPDPVSLRGDATGFNEGTVLSELLGLLKDHTDYFLIVKTHPLQPQYVMEQSAAVFPDGNFRMDAPSRTNNLELMQHSDGVIGFWSNFLVEANALGKPIFRYFPAEKDAFGAMFPFAKHLRTKTALAAALKL